MDKPPIILFKFATRSRPDKFVAAVKNIFDKVADKDNFKILVTADKDDMTMYNRDLFAKMIPYSKTGKIDIVFGVSKNKIDAINRDMDLADTPERWQILVNFSDDMEFVVFGFDNIIREYFKLFFSDLDGNLHFNDGFTRNLLCTMSIMGRTWYDRFGYIYNSEYKNLYCDNEYTEVAYKLGKMKYFDTIIFKHNHPANIGGHRDEQLIKTEGTQQEDGETFKRRKINNFYL